MQYVRRLVVDEEEDIQQGIYFDIYKKDGSVLSRDLSILSLLSTNNNVFEINSKLDLEQTCIKIPGKLVEDGVIWLYVFYGGHEDAAFEYPTENITVQVPINPRQRLTFSDIINNYVHIQPNRIKGIYVWETKAIWDGGTAQRYYAGSHSGIAVTLRDFNKDYIVNSVIDAVLGMHEGIAKDEVRSLCRSHLFFDHDIDFDNSYIDNLYSHQIVTATIIFEY